MNAAWTIETYAVHNEALRAAEEKFHQERDRRYSEVKAAEEKAIKVKEKADEAALKLDQEIRAYKDDKANRLREQIEGERGNYVAKAELRAAVEKLEAMLNPVIAYVASQQGRQTGVTNTWAVIITLIGLLGGGGLIGWVMLFTRGVK